MKLIPQEKEICNKYRGRWSAPCLCEKCPLVIEGEYAYKTISLLPLCVYRADGRSPYEKRLVLKRRQELFENEEE